MSIHRVVTDFCLGLLGLLVSIVSRHNSSRDKTWLGAYSRSSARAKVKAKADRLLGEQKSAGPAVVESSVL
jgi:hypothetical protein